jgi:membrane peptidoglycan carboxypeptidase
VAPGGGSDPATVEDVTLTSGINCAETASTSTGSTCKSFTSYNAFFPGLAKDTKRVVQETDDVHIYDGGADGVASTPADNTVFLRQGIFVP